MDLTAITIIVQLVFLEGILSIDNAAVLGAMVAHLPDDKPIPWPRWLAFFNRWSGRLGSQREAALRVGLLGAYLGRALMLLVAGLIIQIQWIRVVGALYLLYLGIAHLAELYREQQIEKSGTHVAVVRGGFWATVLAVEAVDLAFSIDNVIAAVALSNQMWVVILGVAIGMVIMRFAANLFSQAIAWEPALETGAYLLLLTIGTTLLLKEFLHLHVEEFVQFGVSASVLALTVVFARSPMLRRFLVVFRPLMAASAALHWLVERSKSILMAPFRRQSLPTNEG